MLKYKEIWKLKEKKKAWKSFLKRTQWEVFITFTFERNPRNFIEAYRMVKSYFDKVRKQYSSIQFGALSVALIDKYNLEGTIHIHSLLYSNKRYPKRVTDLINDQDLNILESHWLENGLLTIDKIYNVEGVCSYIADKNIRFDADDAWELFQYRPSIFTTKKGEDYNDRIN